MRRIDLRGATSPVDYREVVPRADFVPLPDPHRPEQPLGRVLHPQQVVHQRPVAVLEDVEGSGHPREQHGVKREHRHPDRHGSNVVPSLEWTHDSPDRPPWSRSRSAASSASSSACLSWRGSGAQAASVQER